MSKQKSRLSRAKIAAAAVAIADKEGFAAVSMRRIAQDLSAGTMSLYYYVKTKDDLLAAMDDALLAEILLPSVPKGWRRAMLTIAEQTRAVFIRHPWALVAMLSAPPGLNAMRHMEQCLEALAETSMTAKQKFTLLAAVDDFVFGHALREAAAEATVDMEFAAAQLATGAFPRLAEMFGGGRIGAHKDRFERGLRALLDGFET
ncbi:MAG: TetR/AcrR family transcriptional regulator C-terminal domain-containing protein [Bryobacteraceae bacterium]|jgi:AcrR family transcriptional regulator